MALIKRSRIEDKGEVLIKTRSVEVYDEQAPSFEEQIKYDEPSREEPLNIEYSEAETHAREILLSARSESESIRESAYNDGVKQGKAEASQKIKEAFETLNSAVKERKKIIKDSEAEILRLSLKAAEQIIRSEVSLHRDVCLNIVSEAINRVSDREQIIIKVNREDAEYIKRYKDRISGLADGVKSLSILEDASIEPGGCIIETNLGYVDARISTKIQAIEDAFKKASEEGE